MAYEDCLPEIRHTEGRQIFTELTDRNKMNLREMTRKLASVIRNIVTKKEQLLYEVNVEY